MSTLEIVFYIIPCILQIFAYYLDWKRIHLTSAPIGMSAFIFIVIGLICLVGAFGLGDYKLHENFFILARIFLILGSTTWIATSILWFTHRVTIEKSQTEEEK